LGIYHILVSMYTTFNVIYLRFVSSDIEVGYYYTSTKLFYLILGIFSAFTSVMLPRMSSLLAEKNIKEFNQKINSSFQLVISCSLPVVIFSIVFAPQIINILSGNGYEGAIIPMRIIMPLILVTGIAQIIAIQILMPMKKDNVVLISSIIGAFVGISANVLLVERLEANGSAIVLLLSEVAGISYSFFFVLKKKIIKLPFKYFFSHMIYSFPYIIFCLLITYMFNSTLLKLLYSAIICVVYFVFLHLFIVKEGIVYNQIFLWFKMGIKKK
ncbi:polysaccharide biosynthesis C-terminal domain-containing protein, partial [Bacteroidales bacterium OttesenSCG-928-M06]|nr:polysaccharide biosynthesis C-terminal domain-containing protein [Bacteroidales bacterium OttesenSCG-928-M06]